MSPVRGMLLAASGNRWLAEQATRRRFVRRAVSRFMPGETFDEALAAARMLAAQGIDTIVTQLGENVSDESEAGGKMFVGADCELCKSAMWTVQKKMMD